MVDIIDVTYIANTYSEIKENSYLCAILNVT